MRRKFSKGSGRSTIETSATFAPSPYFEELEDDSIPVDLELKKRAENDFYVFCREVLGFAKMSEVPHRELCDSFSKANRKRQLILMPRNSFKSSVVTVGGTLWTLLKDPDARVLIVSATQKNAAKFFSEIKTHLETNQIFRSMFGEWNKDSARWREDEITINTRTVVKKEPSLMYSSLEKQITTSLHFSHIILDDVVSNNNVKNQEQIEKTITYYKLILSVLDPDGWLRMIGTRYSAMDLYGYIMEAEAQNYDVMVKKAYDELGNPLMPDVLTKEFLENQRKAQGEYIFATQYLNEAVNAANLVFSKERINFYDKPPTQLEVFMSVSPAVTGPAGSSYSGILVLGVDVKENWYVLDASPNQLTILPMVDEIIRLAKLYKVNHLILEKFNLKKVLEDTLRKRFEDEKLYCPIKEIETSGATARAARIRSLQPIIEAGRLFIKKEHTALFHQLSHYPQVLHDYLVDAIKNFVGNVYSAKEPYTTANQGLEHLTPVEQRLWVQCRKLDKRKAKPKWTKL